MADRTVSWPEDDALVLEVEAISRQMGLSFRDTVTFLVGYGASCAADVGLVGSRVTNPLSARQMLSELANHLGVDISGA